MKTAMILAAGRGERMRPLTDHTPKPLLQVGGKPLIVWHIERLAAAGYTRIVINHAHFGAQIEAALGNGTTWGVSIMYSREATALETAGGIATALPMLVDGDCDAFWVVSGDIYAPDFKFDAAQAQRFAATDLQAHLWLVPNPAFHTKGDFGLDSHGYGLADGAGPDGLTWTYANFALCRASLVAGIAPGTKAALGPLLFEAMRQRAITAEVYSGPWGNVGTPEQLAALN